MGQPDLQRRLDGLSPAQREAVLSRLRAQAPASISAESRDGKLVLSHAQERIYFLEQLSEDGMAYLISGGVSIRGELQAAILDRALQAIIARHESLRTSFPNGEVQISEFVPAPALSAEPLSTGLNLATGPLYHFFLRGDGDGEHTLFVTLHHIIADGWSLGLLLRETCQLYDAFAAGRPAPLVPLKVQYVDFAAWQRGALQGEALTRQITFWREQLAGAPQFLNLPTDFPRPVRQDFRGANYAAALPPVLVEGLRRTGAAEGASLYTTALTALGVLLARYSGQDDLLIGSPVANRTRTETEQLIGLFVNTLVLRIDLAGNPAFRALLQRVQATVRDAFAHQETPFDLLVDALQPERNLSHSPLFQVMFSLQNAHAVAAGVGTRSNGLEIVELPPSAGTAKFDLSLFLEEGPGGLVAMWEYATSLFSATTVERMHGHFVCLLESIVAQPDTPASELNLVPAAEREMLLQEWNRTSVEIPENDSFPVRFARQVAATPDAVAVRDGEGTITYAELNARANRLARYLLANGIGREAVVGLYCSRSLPLMVGVLGILKAGAAYLPLDIAYPADRVCRMLEDAQVALVVTQSHLAGALPGAAPLLTLDTAEDAFSAYSSVDPEIVIHPDQLAYVLYTSGSTGTPKGVEIVHRGLANYLRWALAAYDVASGSGAPMASSISFDATITAWFLPLLAGGAVRLIPEGDDVEALRGILSGKEGYSLIKITPAHLDAVRHLGLGGDIAQAAKAFVIGGEALLATQISFWQQQAPGVRMINEYGPTETVVGCCVYEVPPGFHSSGAVPIGRPIANTRLYVLDAYGQPAPLGVPGELYIGGEGVARGYRRRPDLTAERFSANPFAAGRLYRTGDLVKYLPDGNLVFLGRLDDQVKIRGFRVELGEVEAALARHPQVKECAIVAEPQRLLAYVVSTGERPSTRELRAFLAGSLPEYMVPALFTWVEAMPYTRNGKLNRGALPAPEAPEMAERTAPRNATEREMASLWTELLGLSEIGVHDNFFELGGHSLLAIQLVSRIRQRFGVELPLRGLFETPTVAGCVALLPRMATAAAPQIRRALRDQYRVMRSQT